MPTAESEAEHVATPSFWISRKRKRGQTRPSSLNFPKLLDGEEPDWAWEFRRETFNKLWSEQDRVIQEILATFNEKITNELSEFVKSPPERDETFNTISSAFILAGSNIAGHARLFTQVKERLKIVTQGPVIVLSAIDTPNLQILLRKIISGCLEIDLDDENDEQAPSKHVKLPGRLPYDLEILEEWYQSQQPTADFRITLAFQDTEAFPVSLISDFILRNQARLSRLPFALLFGVASTIEQFQLMLPTSVIKALDWKVFKARQSNECLRIIVDKILMEDGDRLRLGHKVLENLINRYGNWNQSVEDFISGIKYAYMCHFYGNPLSVLIASADPDILPTLLTKKHLDAVRSLPSVRKFVETKLAENETAEVRAILSDDAYLATDLIPHFVNLVRDKAHHLRHTLLVLEKLAERHPEHKRGLSSLYLNVLKEDYEGDSPYVREVLLYQRKFSSMSLVAFLTSSIDVLPPSSEIRQKFEGYLDEIEGILADNDIREPSAAHDINQRQTLISEYDIHERPGMRSTKVSQMLRQQKDRANMTREDQEYTKLVENINDYLKELFATLSSPTTIPLHEVFYFNTTKTHADVFRARPREVLKRALCHPADYLNCACCKKKPEDAAIRSTQPATSILYELYLDSATGLINLYDLFGAFCQVQQGKEGDDKEDDEEQMLASFMASLDELVWTGYVKKSFRKTDHVEKLVGE